MNLRYYYRAKSALGDPVFGEIIAESEARARIVLRARDLTPTLVRPMHEEGSWFSRFFKTQVSRNDLIHFVRQLQNLIMAGSSPKLAIEVLASTHKRGAFAATLQQLNASMSAGGSLSDSLAQFPQIFDSYFISVVRAGERIYRVDLALESLLSYLTSLETLRQSIMALSRKMIASVFFVLISLGFLFGNLVPQLEVTLVNAGLALPIGAQMIFSFSSVVQSALLILLGVFLLTILSYALVNHSFVIRRHIFERLFFLPVIGPMLHSFYFSQFCRSLATTLKIGLELPLALEVCGRARDNTNLRGLLHRLNTAVARGHSLSVPLMQEPFISKAVASYVGVGEETGQLPESLVRISEHFEGELAAQFDSLQEKVWPLIVVISGLVAGAWGLSFLWPVLSPTLLKGFL